MPHVLSLSLALAHSFLLRRLSHSLQMSINVKFDEFDSRDVFTWLLLHWLSNTQRTSTHTTQRCMSVSFYCGRCCCWWYCCLFPDLSPVSLAGTPEVFGKMECGCEAAKPRELYYTVSTVHTYSICWYRSLQKITLSTDATATAIVAAFAVAMISYAFDAQVSTDKMNISNLCVFFSLPFACLFAGNFRSFFFVHLANLNIKYQHVKRFVAFYSEILSFCFWADSFIDEIEWLQDKTQSIPHHIRY